MLEVRNLCKTIECNYAYPQSTNFPSRFVSNKCYIENNKYCSSQTEKNAVYKIQEIIHESDFSTSIKLGDDVFGIIANSKNEDAIVFAVGDPVTSNEAGTEEEETKLKKKKLKKKK